MKKNLLIFLLGSLCNLAFAPFEFLPILLVIFPFFFKLLNEAETSRQAFWKGWWFGFGYFVFGLYWVANSLLVDAEKFAWMIPFAIAGLPSILAIYIGLVGWSYKKIITIKELSLNKQILLFINLWVLAEILRSFILTGFPWNLIGYASLGFMPIAQYAKFITIYGVSFLVLYIAFLPLYWKKPFTKQNKFFWFSLIPILAFGFLLNQDVRSLEGSVLKIRIVQPNIEQKMRWESGSLRKNFADTLELATQGDKDKFDAIILPESGTPFHINREPWVIQKLAEAAPENGVIITGTLRSEGNTKESFKVWNSLYVINSKAEVEGRYDKHHLVPLGEYVPLRHILPLDKITPGMFDFSSGEKIGSMELIKNDSRNLTFNPLICYEVIFPEYGYSDNRYDFILNITNDAWFGDATGPYQHLAKARMRAIEQGSPVVRAANTGVSAFIDHLGKVQKSIDLNKKGVIDVEYIIEAKSDSTLFKIHPYVLLLIIMLMASFRITFQKKD